MAKESNLELKVGGFVILSVACLAIFILSVGDFSIFKKGETITVIFDFAGGVKKSAPVRVAGVNVGLVQDVKLFLDPVDHKTKAKIVVWVNQGVEIPADSRVMINQLGLFGEKYIEIFPGKDQSHFYQPGDVITGKDPIVQEQIAQKILDVADKVQLGVEGFNSIIRDENNQQSLKKTFEQLSLITERLDRMAERLEKGEGTIGKLLSDSRLYEDLEGMAADLKANPWKLLYRPRNK